MHQDGIVDGNSSAIDLVYFAFHLERLQVGDIGKGLTGRDVVTNFERLRVVPALRVVWQIGHQTIHGACELHVRQAGFGAVYFGKRLVAKAGLRGNFRRVGTFVQV